MLEIETVAVLGAGRDGVRFALLSSLAGLDVRLWDGEEVLDAAFHELREEVERALADGRLDRDQRQRAFDGILFTPVFEEAVLGADLVFEAREAGPAAARALLARLAGCCRATALLATRLDPAPLAGALAQPGRVVGIGVERGDGLFPRLSLMAGSSTPHARERAADLLARLERTAGAHR